MKYLLLLPLLILVFSCQNKKKRYTQQSPEIETVKALLHDYNTQNWDQWKSHYGDTAKIYYNTAHPISYKEGPGYHKQNDMNLTNRGFGIENAEYERIIDDQGRTWVNFWDTWKGTLAADGRELSIPVHLTYNFVDGKIVQEYGYWNNASIVLALQEIEANNSMEEEKSN